jgi:tetratricopeptide (TPR) repeat protein
VSLLVDARLRKAHEHARRGEVLQAELLYLAVLRDTPTAAEAAHALGMLAAQRADWPRALTFYQQAHAALPHDPALQPAA